MLKSQTEGEVSPTSVKKGTMLAYLFDCLMKTLLMLVDGVMEDREQYAKDESKRTYRIIDELEKSRD
jgi:hypothetical protein